MTCARRLARFRRIAVRPQSLRRLLDVFWILGAGVLLLGVGEIVQAHRQVHRLTQQVIPYSLAVHDLGAQFFAYDGALNMYVGLPAHAHALRRATLTTIHQDYAALGRALAVIQRASPSSAFHRQVSALERRFLTYQRDAKAVVEAMHDGHRSNAKFLQDVGNSRATDAVVQAIQRLRTMNRQDLVQVAARIHHQWGIILKIIIGTVLVTGGLALELRSWVGRNVANLTHSLTQFAAGDLRADIPPSSLREFQTIGQVLQQAREEVGRTLTERDWVISHQEEVIQQRTAELEHYSRALENVHTLTQHAMRQWSLLDHPWNLLIQVQEYLPADGVTLWTLDPWQEVYRGGSIPWSTDEPAPDLLRTAAAPSEPTSVAYGTVVTLPEHTVLLLPWRTYRSGRSVLMFIRSLDHPWSDRDSRLAALANSRVQLLMDNASLFRDVRQRAISDQLTGLYNRWQFWDDLARQYTEHDLSLLLVDLDYLKRVNDTGGHAAGDAALQRVAQALQHAAEQSGTVYRIGGDEFAVILPAADPTLGQLIYQRATAMLAPDLSVSGGIAMGSAELSAEALMQRADRALYQAKEAGRARMRQAD